MRFARNGHRFSGKNNLHPIRVYFGDLKGFIIAFANAPYKPDDKIEQPPVRFIVHHQRFFVFQSKTDSLALVGFVIAQYGIWQAFIRFPMGIVSDWVGRRKPFIVGGFALAGLGALVMGRASGIDELAIGRAITGLAAGTWVVLVVGFSSLFPPREAVRASALLTFITSLGRMLATG
ncbi:MAG: MFS transporter, partial [Gammaproteobacteria bacterium]